MMNRSLMKTTGTVERSSGDQLLYEDRSVQGRHGKQRKTLTAPEYADGTALAGGNLGSSRMAFAGRYAVG